MLAALLNGEMRVWSTATGKILQPVETLGFPAWPGNEAMDNLAFTPDGTGFAGVGSRDFHRLYLWSVKSGKLAFQVRSMKVDSFVTGFVISPDSSLLAVGGKRDTAIFNRRGAVVCRVPKPGPVQFEADHSLWTAYENESDRKWKCAGAKAVERPATGAPERIAISTGKEWEQNSYEPETIRITSTRTGKTIATVSVPGRPPLDNRYAK